MPTHAFASATVAPSGVLPPSGGDALIYGQSICTPGGLDNIHQIMGVCPQFDVLWGELNGSEHLNIYGHVKGIKFSRVSTCYRQHDSATLRAWRTCISTQEALKAAFAVFTAPLLCCKNLHVSLRMDHLHHACICLAQPLSLLTFADFVSFESDDWGHQFS